MVPATRNDGDSADSDLAGVQYVGISGATASCVEALANILMTYDVKEAKLLSNVLVREHGLPAQGRHAFILKTKIGDLMIVKGGFTSGYSGEGPGGLGRAIRLLELHKVPINECMVDANFLSRLNRSSLTNKDIQDVNQADGFQGNLYPYGHGEYSRESQGTWRGLPHSLPLALIDDRILDLAATFWGKPTDCLREAFVRLEESVRARTGLTDHGSNLFRAAFMPGNALLTWPSFGEAERAGRAALFDAAMRAHRNPRAHRLLDDSDEEQISEFLLVNHLFLLERASVSVSAQARGVALGSGKHIGM